MAFAGTVSVTCGSSGQANIPGTGVTRQDTQPLFGYPAWSKALDSGATTPQAALSDGSVFRIRAHVDAYVAVGKAPDASKAESTSSDSARIEIGAGETVDIYVKAGDKCACLAA